MYACNVSIYLAYFPLIMWMLQIPDTYLVITCTNFEIIAVEILVLHLN